MRGKDAKSILISAKDSLGLEGEQLEAFEIALRAVGLHKTILEDIRENYLDALDDYPGTFTVGFCEGVKYCLSIIDTNIEGEEETRI